MKDLRTLAEAAKATEGSPEWYAHDEAFMEAVTPDAILSLLDERDALKADAARYRWLRDSCLPREVEYNETRLGRVDFGIAFAWPVSWFDKGLHHFCDATLDAGIDAAMGVNP